MGLESKINNHENMQGISKYWYNGTLFVENIDGEEIDLVVEAIKDICIEGTEVIVSGPISDSLGHEYAFDIVRRKRS